LKKVQNFSDAFTVRFVLAQRDILIILTIQFIAIQAELDCNKLEISLCAETNRTVKTSEKSCTFLKILSQQVELFALRSPLASLLAN